MDSSIAATVSLYTGVTDALAIAGCIFQNLGYQAVFEALGGAASTVSAEDIREALAGLDSSIWASSSRALLGAILEAVTSVINKLFYIALVAGALMIVCALVMSWEALKFKSQEQGRQAEETEV